MKATGQSGKRRSQKDKQMAAQLKRLGVERTMGCCALCYRVVSVESARSRFTHICRG